MDAGRIRTDHQPACSCLPTQCHARPAAGGARGGADLMPPESSLAGKMQGLAGRVAVITEASRNIGRSLALGFAEHGAKVVVADLDLDQATAVADQIEAAGGEALPLCVDISDRDRVFGMADAIRSQFGRIDILVNNASRLNDLQRVPFQQIDPAEWRSTLDVNVTGTFHCIRAIEPDMRAQNWGRIVNVSSGTVRMGRPHFLHYVTSKSALIGMIWSLARELGPHGITVNTLLAGVVFTADQRNRLPENYKTMIV
ncbi:SDR family oxidoreductase [Tardiphaga sp. vice154]|nr:SDR family oxidoreductase [Tardiphaga sp. vice154]